MLNISLPQLDKPKKAKDLIISILSMKPPLSSKKIYNEVKRRFGYSITYQAIHKTILQLLEEGVLVKEDMEYSINMQWIDEVSNFAEKLKESYEQKEKYPDGIIDMQTTDNMQMIIFNNFLSAETFNMKILDRYCFNPRNKEPCCAHIQHVKRPVFQSGDAYETLRIFKKCKTKKYILVRGNGFLDKWSADFFKDIAGYLLGIDVAKDYETYILGDTVTQLYIPPEISKKLDFLYANTKRIEDLKMPEVYTDIYERKCKAQLLIFKNPELAEQLRQKTLSYFR